MPRQLYVTVLSGISVICYCNCMWRAASICAGHADHCAECSGCQRGPNASRLYSRPRLRRPPRRRRQSLPALPRNQLQRLPKRLRPITTSTTVPATAPTAAATSAAQAPRAVQPTEVVTSTVAPAATSAGAAQKLTAAPRFTHPTEITNPFYPVSLIGQAISLGTEGGGPFRTEVTLLPGARTIAIGIGYVLRHEGFGLLPIPGNRPGAR